MKAAETAGPGILARYPSLAYVAPFAVFLGFLALGQRLPGGAEVLYPIRVLVVSVVLIGFSRSVIDFRVKNALGERCLTGIVELGVPEHRH